MSRSLVLNASYEPLGTVASRRAVVLVLGQKADAVHDTEIVLHAERLEVPIPSVVRLRQFVHVPFRRRVSVSRRAVMARDSHRCQYCGAHADSIDHVRPRSKGGTHTWDNVVAACRRCNSRKENRLIDEVGLHLARRPVAPKDGFKLSIGRLEPEWEPFLMTP
jgi:5-methylcytosine-specific restriction endonuclease McrA